MNSILRLCRSLVNLALNSVPLSVITWFGHPKRFRKSKKHEAVVYAFELGIGYNSIHLLKVSIMIMMYRLLLLVRVSCRSLVRSICIIEKGRSPFWVGFKEGFSINFGFIYEQCSQWSRKRMMSLLSVGQKYVYDTLCIRESSFMWPSVSCI